MGQPVTVMVVTPGGNHVKAQQPSSLRAYFGLSWDDYLDMLYSQDGKCAICLKVSDKTLQVDHCHATGMIRGLLCGSCNKALGQLRDCPESALRAYEYLIKHRDSPSNVLVNPIKLGSRTGEGHHKTKLTNESVRQIRQLYASGISSIKLADRFEVSSSTILNIVNRKTWRSVE